MINITRNKRLFAKQQLQQINFLEMKMYHKLNPILKGIWNDVSEKIKHGDPLGIVPYIVNNYSKKLKDLFLKQYKLVGEYNFKQVSNRMQELKPKKVSDYYYKDANYNFWYYFDLWSKQQAMNKVTYINTTTRNILKNIIDNGIKDNKSYVEISKIIKGTLPFTKNRSMMIAITETHSAFNKSIFNSIESTNVKMETKEWMNAGDERVRQEVFNHVRAQGEKVGMHEMFHKTGEALEYPGDPNGKAANIIRCRCVALYNTKATSIEMTDEESNLVQQQTIQEETNKPVESNEFGDTIEEQREWGEASVLEYSESEDQRINAYLRGTKEFDELSEKVINEKIRAIDNYIKISDKYEGLSYRGVYLENDQLKKQLFSDLNENGIIELKGYISTTKNINILEKFGSTEATENLVYVIKGKNGVDISKIASSRFQKEEEVLYKYNTKFKVLKKYTNEKGNFLELMEL